MMVDGRWGMVVGRRLSQPLKSSSTIDTARKTPGTAGTFAARVYS
jgi:hypothetical protein